MGIERIKEELVHNLPQVINTDKVVDDCVQEKDTVLIVLSQELSALSESLATSYIHTLTELLNQKCIVVTTTEEEFEVALLSLTDVPKLIITDTKSSHELSAKIPEKCRITTFGC